ncbi:CHAT domain-containing protein [Lentzea sp. CC55]|uniref:CHAT domain-containing protein n=1 Tax=Lentzea sp. CC55 TaxID=2884909 RepID=UPI0027DFB2E7|nr:CHAT domain-containing protein [Lentzea sp. CC55]MCG8927428.1 CHAT domain-containing protein [Lentzea sp. CC55]
MGDALALLELVFARPTEAVAEARALLDGAPTALEASVAHHVIGLAQREYGDLNAAIAELRTARALARKSGSNQRLADVLATLGIATVHAGRTSRGLAILDEAVDLGSGAPAARVRFRRAGALWIVGRHQDALADLRVAVPALRRAGDVLWTARALTLRGLINLAFGLVGRADSDLLAAERMFTDIDERHASAFALHNRGLVAFRSGDLPAALSCLDEVERRYRELGTSTPELAIDRCAILLCAGLVRDAVAVADSALTAHRRGQATRRAELLLVAARVALAAGDQPAAQDRAAAAAALFAAQRRQWWYAHARLLLLQARFAAGATGRLLGQAERVARQLDALGSPDVVQAHLLAGRVALARGSSPTAHLGQAALARRRGRAIGRVDGWLAQALLAHALGDRRRMLAACRRGLDLLDEHRLTLGASELRAHATARGTQLAELAIRDSVANPRGLLRWSERWRATACAMPPIRPPDDPVIRGDFAALREVTHRLRLARGQRAPTHALESERSRLERLVRARTLHTAGGTSPSRAFDPAVLLDSLGGGRLLELVDINGDLHLLVCGSGRVRRVRAGRTGAAKDAVEAARTVLRRLSYAPPEGDRLLVRLTDLGKRLEEILLGPAVRLLGDGPVVIVPPGRLHGVPWSLLPALDDRVHAVAPSAATWLNSRTAKPVSNGVVLVRGPSLGTAGAEVPALSRMYPDARVLADGSATAADVLDSLGGAALAHVAAHGTFRADNALFSALHLDDGPLTVYDFERLPRAPHRIVLPSCGSGRLLPLGADELLGLTAALLPLGTAGIVASLVTVNDAATVPLMVALHKSLRTGEDCAKALWQARRAASDEPVHRATAASFIALGAG